MNNEIKVYYILNSITGLLAIALFCIGWKSALLYWLTTWTIAGIYGIIVSIMNNRKSSKELNDSMYDMALSASRELEQHEKELKILTNRNND